MRTALAWATAYTALVAVCLALTASMPDGTEVVATGCCAVGFVGYEWFRATRQAPPRAAIAGVLFLLTASLAAVVGSAWRMWSIERSMSSGLDRVDDALERLETLAEVTRAELEARIAANAAAIESNAEAIESNAAAIETDDE